MCIVVCGELGESELCEKTQEHTVHANKAEITTLTCPSTFGNGGLGGFWIL